jgi:hypothetical protein
MNPITIPDQLKPQFALPGPIPVLDEAGSQLGVFLPTAKNLPGEPYWTREELEAARNEPGGCSLDEIWKSLGVK